MTWLPRTGGAAGVSATLVPMANSNQAIRALLEAIDDPAMIVESQVVRLANEPAKALLGRSIEGGDVRLAIRHPQALEFVLAGRTGDVDFTGVGSVGRPWRLSVRPAGDSALLLRLIDRSAIHAAEKLRVDFVANASHELRTPLTAVLGYAESLEDGDLDPDLTAKFARTIRSEAKRMLRIIEDLMSLSRIEADRFVAPTDSVSIESVVRSAVETVRPIAQHCGCSLHVELQDDLPAVQGDLPQLVQVMDNLLSNAVRYGCAVPECKIRVSATLDRQGVRLEVSDTGPGIPREHLPFLTRRFYRVDPARSRETGGTGLGLAIVKHIVERHRGTLSIDSDRGKGTTVTILLPLGH
ncbi:MAG TPA: ATP-binding protein [Sphingomicrobium sp.]|nr:ATP-binding protein [Sphingomicrobium sp.]